MDHRDIYAHHAVEYDQLVEAEDCDGNLAPALAALVPLAGQRIVEVGAGTGRLTRLLVHAGAHVIATEPSEAMLALARQHLAGNPQVEFHCAWAHDLPLPDQCADAAMAGWVFGHLRYWMPADWRADVGRALAELTRVLRPGGAMVIIETLGTGATEPAPPSPELAEYYQWLEQQGFSRTWVRTDYYFESVDRAAAVTGFFFGEEFAARVRQHGWTRVPECTGIWTRRVQSA